MIINEHHPIFRFSMLLVMCIITFRLLSDVRNARKTGVAHIVGQVTKGYERTQRPIMFWSAVSFALVLVALLLCETFLIAREIVQGFIRQG
jgi:hypothetical protein